MYSTARERSLQLNTYWGWGALSASARRTTSAALALHNKGAVADGDSTLAAHLLHTKPHALQLCGPHRTQVHTTARKCSGCTSRQ